MSKSLSERIGERAIKNALARAGNGGTRNRATFLKLRPEIAKALDDGWSVRAIWKTLNAEGKIPFSYDPFRKYVRQLVELPKMHARTSKMNISSSADATGVVTTESGSTPRPTSLFRETPVDRSEATPRSSDNEPPNPRHARRPPAPGFRLGTLRKEDLI